MRHALIKQPEVEATTFAETMRAENILHYPLPALYARLQTSQEGLSG